MGPELSLTLYVFNPHHDPKEEVQLFSMVQVKSMSHEG